VYRTSSRSDAWRSTSRSKACGSASRSCWDTAPGGAVEIAGDELTGSRIAAAFGEHAGLPARYEALPLEVLGDDAEARAMFRWFAETSAHQADIGAVKAIEPSAWDLPAWLRSGGWTLPAGAYFVPPAGRERDMTRRITLGKVLGYALERRRRGQDVR
jgi:hypothetical protein